MPTNPEANPIQRFEQIKQNDSPYFNGPIDYRGMAIALSQITDYEERQKRVLPMLQKFMGKLYHVMKPEEEGIEYQIVRYPGLSLLAYRYADTEQPDNKGYGLVDITPFMDEPVVHTFVNLLDTPPQELATMFDHMAPRQQDMLLSTFPTDTKSKITTLVSAFSSKPNTIPVVLSSTNTTSDAIALAENITLENETAVPTHFDPYALNYFNAAYYSHPNAFDYGEAPPDVLVTDPALQIAFARFFPRFARGSNLRIKELFCGGKSRWQAVLQHINQAIQPHIVLSDFTTTNMPKNLDPVQFEMVQDNMLDTLPQLPETDKADILMTTYGFDSVWFPQDRTYTKYQDTWYRHSYRIAITDKTPLKYRDSILDILKGTGDVSQVPISAFKSLQVEEIQTRVDINQEPFGETITARFADTQSIKVNVPGGLVAKVDEAFENQIRPGGAFLIADVATTATKNMYKKRISSYREISSGSAKFKVEDYGLARELLEARGYTVRLQPIGEFIHDATNGDQTSKIYGDTHYILIITKDSSSIRR